MLKINRRLENPIYYGAKAKILKQAGELRKDLTKAEKKLWMKLRKKQLMGYKFRRQHAINQFVADYYCHNAKLVIEIDGEYHNISEQIEYDEGRTAELNNMGLTVIRFTNKEIENEMEEVIKKISKYLLK